MAPQFRLTTLTQEVSRAGRTLIDYAMGPAGVTRSQWSVLVILSQHATDGMVQRDLGRLLELGKPTLGGLVDRLEAVGHVERRADPNDRRAKRVYTTKQGQRVIKLVSAVVDELDRRLLNGISIEKRRVAEEVLLRVKQNMKEILRENADDGGRLQWFGSEISKE